MYQVPLLLLLALKSLLVPARSRTEIIFFSLDTMQYPVNGPDCSASVTQVTDITDGDLMSPRLRGAGRGKCILAQMF